MLHTCNMRLIVETGKKQTKYDQNTVDD